MTCTVPQVLHLDKKEENGFSWREAARAQKTEEKHSVSARGEKLKITGWQENNLHF